MLFAVIDFKVTPDRTCSAYIKYEYALLYEQRAPIGVPLAGLGMAGNHCPFATGLYLCSARESWLPVLTVRP